MILYHTSDIEIRKPDIHFGRKNADFGQGFYLTPDKEFTYRWARENAVVNVYELDTSGLDIRTLSRNLEWSGYIFDNRRGRDTISSDAVIGPIANDTIFDTLGVVSSGFLAPEDALKLLLIGPEYIQLAVKTQKAADQLRWLSSERITRVDTEAFRAEQDRYQQEFFSLLEKLTD